MQLQQAYDEERVAFGNDDDYALALRLQKKYDKEREERTTFRNDYEGKLIV